MPKGTYPPDFQPLTIPYNAHEVAQPVWDSPPPTEPNQGVSFKTSAMFETQVIHEEGGENSEISFCIYSSSIKNFNAALEELILQLQALKMETVNSD